MNPDASGTRTDPLADHLARAAARDGAPFEAPTSIEREPFGSGWYATEKVTARFPSGHELRCFLKDFGSFDRPKSRMAERRERERFFYKSVLSDGELGVARYVADVWEPETNRYWLLIEFVEGVPLSWCEMDTWYEAAEWLGRLRATLEPRLTDLAASGVFTDHGPRYFASAADRALDAATTYSPALGRAVATSTPAYLRHAIRFAEGPKTLVHGAFRPEQVLVDASCSPARICPTDWEIAAIGAQLYDLATLADGFEGEQLEELAARYRSGAGLAPDACTAGDLQSAVEACRMHRTMKWIGSSRKRDLPEEKVAELVHTLEATAAEAGTA